MSNIAKNLRLLRKGTGLSQEAFGELFDLTRGKIASYESGTLPKIDTLLEIANHFNIGIEAMILQDIAARVPHPYYPVKENPSREEFRDQIVREPDVAYRTGNDQLEFILLADINVLRSRLEVLERMIRSRVHESGLTYEKHDVQRRDIQ